MATTRRSRSKLPTGLHRIAQVSRKTGVTEHTLRIWERRYGNIASHRSPAGYRLYTDDDLARVRAIKDLLEDGYAIGEIATLSSAELSRLRAKAAPREPALPAPVLEVANERFLSAIERYDIDEAGRVAASAMVAFGPYELVTQMAVPLLHEIGQRWQDKQLSVAQEHAASAILRGQLWELLRAARPRVGSHTVVTTTPVGELHEFGALIAGIVAAVDGAHIVYLGPNTPPADIANAVKKSRADVVMLSVVCLEHEVADRALRDVRTHVPADVDIWVGGRALTAVPKGVSWVRSLPALREKVQVKGRGILGA